MNPFWMVLADLRKTLLASLGILVLLALAFSGTVAVNLFDRSLRDAGASSAQDFDLVVGAPGSKLDLVLASVYLRTDEVLPLLPYDEVTKLQADPRVKALSPLVFADHNGDYPIVGVGAAFPQLRPTLKLASGHWPEKPFEVVAGAVTGVAIGAEFHGSHGATKQVGVDEEVHNQAAYHVVGTLAPTKTPWDRSFLTTYDSIWILHGTLDPDASAEELATVRKVSAILVKPKDFASAYALRAEYQKAPTTAAFPGEVLAGLFGLFDQVKSALSLLGLLFQALVFAAVLLSLLAGLPSKAQWIGLLRALGAGPVYVFLTLWIQTALIFTAAGLAGAVFGWLGAGAVAAYVGAQSGLALSLSWTWGETSLLALFWLVGLVGALVPAVVGYRTSVRASILGL
jgi:putative ABC transport system permease protein